MVLVVGNCAGLFLMFVCFCFNRILMSYVFYYLFSAGMACSEGSSVECVWRLVG